jgi:RNA polymerase sigma factor (sigma-70 family)
MRLALNEAKKLLKKKNRRLSVEVKTDTSRIAGGVDPSTGIDSLDMLAAVDRLDPEERALLGMRYVAGFDATELATALGLSPSGTRSRIERLLGRLRKELE